MTASNSALEELSTRIETARSALASAGGVTEQRRYAEALREAVHLYRDTVANDAIAPRVNEVGMDILRTRVREAFDYLGGQPEPAIRSLKDYHADRFGPYLGVSGDQTAAAAIREAALASPKVVALELTDPLEIGVAHDAERLGSIGELPVGPDEYRDIRMAGMGRILTSTNVGSRANLRVYGRIPVVWVNRADPSAMFHSALESCRRRFAPFLQTPDGRPRPARVHIQFRSGVSNPQRLAILRKLVAAIHHGEIGSPSYHQLALLVRVRRGDDGVKDALAALRLAQRAGIGEVAIEGTVRTAATDVISAPGLLQYFNVYQLNRLLGRFAAARIQLAVKDRVDTESVARELWSSLHAARSMGLELGKYGLFPLTLKEADAVVRHIQEWFRMWTAAPAIYVDVPVVLANTVVPTHDVARGLKLWLDMARAHGVPVVLIDTVFKGAGRRLMKDGGRDAMGFLTAREIQSLDRYARRRGIRVLWAGGISSTQAYQFGRIGVFGLYVTSAVAAARPVGAGGEDDPALAFERQPTAEGIARVKLLVEAGFLAVRLDRLGQRALSRTIERLAESLLASETVAGAESQLHAEVQGGWRAWKADRQ